MTTFSQADLSLPDSDGKPMADNTEQFRWIVMIKENLEVLFANDETVFIAGDLLWYPVPTRIIAPVAPDVMVVFGRPKGKRGSYRQWREENIPPQVVFEILSPSNNAEEMERKLEFYDTYGIEEYYLYDPDTFRFDGWHRQNVHLTKLWQLEGQISPRLGIRFETGQGELVIYRPDGQRFLTSIEMDQTAQQERQRAEQAESLLNQERQRSQQLEDYLRSIGVDPNSLP
ncbi:Uma2 family endonuclease [Phormidesmis priestleyi ULC007]|uniref:Uma2 family endonuclease n=1 Tax=Phormidesmis priestleyi ULC007 TaxID=1920490 RepID=A0A2T1D795_9CYAN|nr:Uma2 family endonuclease [Phormidesmis priestleyi]PSB16382.1 Uma2 family endonuclease [Phormidesmis priestleyi ULC007]PZO47192.1 MAG: Uma2 family endonuclease [Phormidesmis priestleyi]